MNLEEIIVIVSDWAKSESIVKRAYIFGSRVRGDYTARSDIDVAVEIYKDMHDNDIILTWGDVHPGLADRLSRLVPFILQLELYEDSITERIGQALRDSSILVYDDKHQASASPLTIQFPQKRPTPK